VTRIRSSAIRTRWHSVAFALLLSACGSSTPEAPGTPPPVPSGGAVASKIDRLLEHSRVSSIVDARAGAFTRQVAYLAGDLTDAELERLVPAVQEAFAPDALRRDVAAYLQENAPDDGTLDTILARLEGGALAELEAIRDGYEPVGSLEDYVRARMDDPPEEARVELVAAWAETQGAGEFFVLMEEALTESAYRVWAAFRPTAPAYEPLPGPELNARLNDSFNASVIGFLRDLEPVPDSVLVAATEEYASDAGQWYVRTYSLAVASAIRAAGERVAETLREIPEAAA
jgi:hypothetical protein